MDPSFPTEIIVTAAIGVASIGITFAAQLLQLFRQHPSFEIFEHSYVVN